MCRWRWRRLGRGESTPPQPFPIWEGLRWRSLLEVDDFTCARGFEQGEGDGDTDKAIVPRDWRFAIFKHGVGEVAKLFDVGGHAGLAEGCIGIFGVDRGLFSDDTPVAIVGNFECFIGIHVHNAFFAHDEGAEGLVGEAWLGAGA